MPSRLSPLHGSCGPLEVVADLDLVRRLSAAEQGLAVAITLRKSDAPRASVVNAGVIEHPVTGASVVSFVSRGDARKLDDLRRAPQATVVFRSGWDWVAVEGRAELAGPRDELEGIASVDALLHLLRIVYAAAAGGTPDEWASLDDSFVSELHAAVLLTPTRIYPATG